MKYWCYFRCLKCYIIFSRKRLLAHSNTEKKKNIQFIIMKKIIPFLFLMLCFTAGFAGEKNLSGVYQGKNLYVMNPFTSSGVGFCVYEVQVNGQVTTDEVNSSAFEIDLSLYEFKKGDNISIKIKYKANCEPKVLNPEVLKPTSTFYCSYIKVSRDNVLTWKTTGEAGSLPFTVEQFRWNKWVKVGTVQGKGTPESNTYQLDVNPHSGNNEFRVKQVDYTKKPKYSKVARFRSMDPEVTYAPEKKVGSEIIFSAETMYEVYDPYGNLMLKGFGNKIDVSSLKPNSEYEYILHFDNKVVQFEKY